MFIIFGSRVCFVKLYGLNQILLVLLAKCFLPIRSQTISCAQDLNAGQFAVRIMINRNIVTQTLGRDSRVLKFKIKRIW